MTITNQQLYKQLAKQIYESDDQVKEGLAVQQIIKEMNNNPVKTNNHFEYTRKQLKELGMTSEQANNVLYRTKEMISDYTKHQNNSQLKLAQIGLKKIPEFNPKGLRQRLDSINIKNNPTLDNVIDLMLAFCMRTNEYNKLRLHLQPDKKTYKISGYSKSKDISQRDFICIYPPSRIRFLIRILNWVQNHSILVKEMIGLNNQLLNKHLQTKYKINAKQLRKYGVDIILQQKKKQLKNPASYQLLIHQATRHVPTPNADIAYGIVNSN